MHNVFKRIVERTFRFAFFNDVHLVKRSTYAAHADLTTKAN
jgi:hypothetical protein